MEKYFSVIALIAFSVFLFSLYYALRQKFRQYKERRLRFEIMRKLYNDERTFICSYLRVLLEQLKRGDLRWIQLFSRLRPSEKIEIVFNHLAGEIEMQNRAKPLNENALSEMREQGLTKYTRRDEINCLEMPVNAKIVTDMLYYNLEELCHLRRAKNIGVKLSGGSVPWQKLQS